MNNIDKGSVMEDWSSSSRGPRSFPSELFVGVDGSAVAYIDIQAVQRDLDAGAKEEAALARFFLSGASFISLSQSVGNAVNESVVGSGQNKTFYRPPGYGRAALTSFHVGGTEHWFDVKGCGVADNVQPDVDSHRTGLYSLERAFSDIIMQKLIEGMCNINNLPLQGTPVYALIDLGFFAIPDIAGKAAQGRRMPAGIAVRAARSRRVMYPSRSLSDRDRIISLSCGYLLSAMNIRSSSAGRFLSDTVCHPFDVMEVIGDACAFALSNAGTAAINHQREVRSYNVQITDHHLFSNGAVEIIDFGHYGISKYSKEAIPAFSSTESGKVIGRFLDTSKLNANLFRLPEELGSREPIPLGIARDLGYDVGRPLPLREVPEQLACKLAAGVVRKDISALEAAEDIDEFVEAVLRKVYRVS